MSISAIQFKDLFQFLNL